MANDEHVRQLYKGVEEWNKWRSENPEVEIDLSNIDLSDIRELYSADLYGADLHS